ncbi:TRAP transporter small permease [Marinihelvus fidelis]|uniref:TRAP transporter small permease protein n=1 Tax=Marinihelvus fidelis TaxID=2613842 RepID=A0A5N0T9W7_9GAMM|nr:TRAP transporter small permease [Marinihelvus fidelis]KAA9130917.1 TRAP transporter small permease [Marinihelvus fidelis]
MQPIERTAGRLEKAGTWVENALLCALLLAMIGLACWQIFARNLFGSTLVLGDELLRLMVLWLTLAGALAASRADRHIAIALLDRVLDGRALDAAKAVTEAFTAIVCALLAWYSYAFVMMSREFEDVLLGGVPAWWLQAPLPIGFGLMAWRHALHAIARALGR